MIRSHACKERDPMRQLRRAFQMGGFSIERPPLLDPYRTCGRSKDDATYRQAAWGLCVIREYSRRVRMGVPVAAYPAEPDGGRQAGQ